MSPSYWFNVSSVCVEGEIPHVLQKQTNYIQLEQVDEVVSALEK